MKNNKNIKKKSNKGCLVDAIIPGFFLLVFIYNVLFNQIKDSLIESNGKITFGYITNEKHTIGNSKVFNETSYNLGYEFEVDKKVYTGNSHTRELPVRAQVKIEYVSFYPRMNRIAK